MKRLCKGLSWLLVLVMLCATIPAMATDDRQPAEGDIDTWVEKMQAALAVNDLEAALDAVTQVIMLDPGNPGPRGARGRVRTSLGDYSGALVDASYSLSLKKDDQIYSDRAFALRELGRYELALLDHAHAIGMNASDMNLYNRASTLMRMVRFDQALADLDQALALEPDEVILLSERAMVLYALGRDDEGAKASARSVELGGDPVTAEDVKTPPAPTGTPWPTPPPGDPKALTQSLVDAAEDMLLDKAAEALALLDQSLIIDPENAQAYVLRGLAHSLLGDPTTALEDFAYALSIEPDIGARSNYAAMLMHLGRFEESLVEMDHVVSLYPDDGQVYLLRGNAYYHLGLYEEAIADYTTVSTLDGDSAKIQLYLGDSYRYLERYDEALTAYKNVLVMEPDNRSAMENIWNITALLSQPAKTSGAEEAPWAIEAQRLRTQFSALLKEAKFRLAPNSPPRTTESGTSLQVEYTIMSGMTWLEYVGDTDDASVQYVLMIANEGKTHQQLEQVYAMFVQTVLDIPQDQAADIVTQMKENQTQKEDMTIGEAVVPEGSLTLGIADGYTYVAIQPTAKPTTSK